MRVLLLFSYKTAATAAEPYFSAVALEPLPVTQDSRDLIQAAQTALLRIWKPGVHYAKAGVMLSDIGDGREQLDLFSNKQPGRNSKALMQIIDKLNLAERGTIFMAGEGVHRKYKGKQQWLSPCYTTRGRDTPVACKKKKPASGRVAWILVRDYSPETSYRFRASSPSLSIISRSARGYTPTPL